MEKYRYVKTKNCVECGMCEMFDDFEEASGHCPYGAIQKVLIKDKNTSKNENNNPKL
jgi:ferredoxin